MNCNGFHHVTSSLFDRKIVYGGLPVCFSYSPPPPPLLPRGCDDLTVVPQGPADVLTLAEGWHRLLCHCMYSQTQLDRFSEPRNMYYSVSYRAVAFSLFKKTVAIANTSHITSKYTHI